MVGYILADCLPLASAPMVLVREMVLKPVPDRSVREVSLCPPNLTAVSAIQAFGTGASLTAS